MMSPAIDAIPGESIWLQGSYEKKSSSSILFKNFNVLTAAGKAFQGDVYTEEDIIKKVGENLSIDADLVIEGQGKYFLTPGLIDTHSHMGVYPFPGASAHEDGNELVKPQTAAVWAEHSFWPQDPGLWRALAGGVTTIQVLPGSGNLIGGRSVTLRTVSQQSVAEMKFKGAPQGLKMACGENPKRVYKEKGGPATRMGNYAGYRRAFQRAWEYQQKFKKYQSDLAAWESRKSKTEQKPLPPEVKHDLDTLVKVLNGEILVHIHCYRADEMLDMIKLADAFGFSIRSFHHALEAYKIAPILAERKIAVSTWADWWGFKMEAFDGVPYNLAMTAKLGGIAVVHSDSGEDVRFLNVEAAKGQQAGRDLGIHIPDEEVIKWVTINPAYALGIDKRVGSIEEGKLADLVVWDGSPFSAYSKAKQVFIQGQEVLNRSKNLRPHSDFERGMGLGGTHDSGLLISNPHPEIPDFKVSPERVDIAKMQSQFLIVNAKTLGDDGEELRRNIAIKDGNIADILPVDELQGYKGKSWPQFDAENRLVTPGFIEAQSVLGTVIVELENSGRDNYSGAFSKPAFNILDAVDPFSLHIPITREQGVTSAIVRPQGGLISGLGSLMSLDQTPQSLESRKQFLFAAVGHKKHNRSHFWLHLREVIEDALALKKQSGTSRSRPLDSHLSLAPIHMQPLLDVLSGKIPLVLALHRVSDVYAALRFKQEMNDRNFPVKIIIEGGSESWLAADRLAKAQIPVIITPTQQLPYQLDRVHVRDDLASFLDQRGVDILFTANDMNVRRLRQQGGRAVAYGLPYHRSIAAITKNVSRAYGLDDRGDVKKGQRADLVIWNGDPLEPSGHVAAMWIRGMPQNLNHRQKELAQHYWDKFKKQL